MSETAVLVRMVNDMQIEDINKIAAPGVARIPQLSNAHRWHQRLGYTGQQILRRLQKIHTEWKGLITLISSLAKLVT